MRAGWVTGTYPRSSDVFIQREVAALRELGVQVETFAVRAPGEDQLVGPEQRAEHARTTYLLPAAPATVLRAHLGLLRRRPAAWRRALGLALRTRPAGLRGLLLQLAYLAEAGLLARLAHERGLEHLHDHFGDSSGTVTMLAAELAGLPFSLTVHGPHVFTAGPRWRLDVKAAQAAFVVCISEFTRSQVMAQTATEHWGRLHVVHCGVVPGASPEPEDEPGRLRLVAVGRLASEKGLPVLFDAVARVTDELPQLRLDLVGDGPERTALEQRVHRLGLDGVVRFLGALDQAGVREQLRTSDALVVASFAEGLPVVIMEAFAAGTTVVATAVAGVPELVRDGENGRLVPPGDAAGLARALRELAELGPQERRARAARGRERVRRDFDVTAEATRLAALLDGRVPPER